MKVFIYIYDRTSLENRFAFKGKLWDNFYYNSCPGKSYVTKVRRKIKENESAFLFYDLSSKLADARLVM